MTVTNINWWKAILPYAISIICTVGSVCYVGGQVVENGKSALKDIAIIKADVKNVKDNQDTLKAQSVREHYGNQLQFQALWNAINKQPIKQDHTFVKERWVNGKLVLMTGR